MRSPARWLFAVFVMMSLFIIYHVASNYLAGRAAKKAALDEYWRREHLAPEQRIAEDKAKAEAVLRAAKEEEWARLRAERAEKMARQQAEAAVQMARQLEEDKELKATGRALCLAWWKKSLRDPDSAKVEEADGFLTNETYYGHITGRAKNGFGGYVRATWDCQLTRSGKDYIPLSLTQRR